MLFAYKFDVTVINYVFVKGLGGFCVFFFVWDSCFVWCFGVFIFALLWYVDLLSKVMTAKLG